ncbi:MAG: hypothetical protein HY725_00535 [Candidatus Rokubacteria bacterium]|nr:hypothetical protein [Candidatus Rokubacteria bacterium]
MDDLRRALLRADPRLSKFQPLSNIIFYDDFDEGLCGWTELIGNYEDSLEQVTDYPEAMDSRPPMLSSLTMHDTGTAGSFHGTYALKIATRARCGHLAKALKRITFRKKARVQCELYFTFKPEGAELKLGERDVRAIGVSYDLQDEACRYWPAIRFLNAEAGARIEKWQYHAGGTRLPHLDGWEDVPDGQQPLCYNEIATKQNWHYLRWLIDLRSREYLELQCNDRAWSLSGRAHAPLKAYPNLRTLFNVGFWVEAEVDKRCFLYVDSVLVSTEE